jgi:DNA-binding NarL/FixJ family response regulator
MKLLIADDHGLFRLGLKAAIEQKIVGAEVLEVDDAKSAMELMEREKDLSLALLDIDIPGNEGLSFIYSTLERYPDIKVCVISGNQDPAIISAVMEKGVKGFIPKASSTEIIFSAIQIILAGSQYFPMEILNKSGPKTNKSLSRLTTRQLDVLKAMANGQANKQIADNLHISVGTVKTHITAIFEELMVNNRTQAINAARDKGLII